MYTLWDSLTAEGTELSGVNDLVKRARSEGWYLCVSSEPCLPNFEYMFTIWMTPCLAAALVMVNSPSGWPCFPRVMAVWGNNIARRVLKKLLTIYTGILDQWSIESVTPNRCRLWLHSEECGGGTRFWVSVSVDDRDGCSSMTCQW
jgi:hypothetical protein